MSLTVGARVGSYEVLGSLGAGGMGEVYLATDTNLKRQVAIKVLPAAVAADPDHLARFQREAEVLAALNHPGIAHIHGLEKADGTIALVMELVEGPTLADRIAQGAIAIEEALPIARQIAEALEAAHEQRIIHRDLKPANIKVRPDGAVKVLDFGLAKAIYPVGASSVSASMSPTLTTPAMMTGVGMILGTAAYMSPEQARGKTVDKRTDIWAFGCVLYEMLTARRAFPGEDVTDTLAAVVRAEPDWTLVPREVAPVLRTFLRRCLEKDPKQRIGDIHDVRLALEGAFDTVASQTMEPAARSAARGQPAWMAAFAVAAVLAAALAVPVLRHLREAPPPLPPETRVDIVTPATDRPESFALSPDGRQIAFVAVADGASRLWLRALAATTAQPLAGTEGAMYPFWSPDGRSIGFFAPTALERIDLAGGTPRTLAVVPAGQGGTWNTDGVIVFAPSSTSGLMRVPAAGGAPVAVTTRAPQQVGHTGPSFLPDGRRFFFEVQAGPDTGIYLGALDGSAPTRLTSNSGDYALLPSGWLMWVRAGALVAQQLDVEKATVTGEPLTVADGVTAVSSAATGLVAYRAAAGGQRQLTWVDRSGTARSTVGDMDGSLVNPSVSPDGRRVIVSRSVGGNQDLWLLDSTRMNRFTFDPAFDRFPVWSPDGTRVVFYSARTGGGDLYVKLVNGTGSEERLSAPEQFKLATSWSADGHFLLFQRTDPQTSSDLWVMSMEGDRTASVFLKTPFAERFGVFSPDGRWVAYQSDESGRNEIYVRSFVTPGAAGASIVAGQWQVSTAGGIMPRWRPDGRGLFYLNPAGAMMAAPITVTGSTLEADAPVVLFPTRIFGGGVDIQQGRQYDLDRDGRFLINTVLDVAIPPITLLQNWRPPAP